MVFYWLRKSAKKRNKPFTIELNWFREWIKKTPYMDGRGRFAGGLNIDRIRNEEGYSPDNIQVLEKIQNITKYNIDKLRAELGPQYEPEDLPF